ncbi:hypothetical protein D3C80_1536380 [compost metagenome]
MFRYIEVRNLEVIEPSNVNVENRSGELSEGFPIIQEREASIRRGTVRDAVGLAHQPHRPLETRQLKIGFHVS